MAGARGGRGGSMGGNRGGLGGGRGRGGSFIGGAAPVRGGGAGGQPNVPLRGQHSRNNFNNGTKDYSNRRGGGSAGSFNAGGGSSGYPHQGPASFRGRNQGQSGATRGNRGDVGNGPSFASREGTQNSSFGGKKDENRRTLTDFKIIGLAISDLGWTWGAIPSSPMKTEDQIDSVDVVGASNASVKEEGMDDNVPLPSSSSAVLDKLEDMKEENSHVVQSGDADMTEVAQVVESVPGAHVSLESSASQPPPSRIRIYFHTPVTADDSRPIPHNSSYGEVPTDTRKGKRKKLEDDDGDMDERRVPPPPPQMGSSVADDRSSVDPSVAASVAETASEADWLMAAIVEGEEEAETADALSRLQDEDEEHSHISPDVKEPEHVLSLDGDDHVDHDHSQDGDETVNGGKQSHTVRAVAISVKAPLHCPESGGLSPCAHTTDFFPFLEGTFHDVDDMHTSEHVEHDTLGPSAVAEHDAGASIQDAEGHTSLLAVASLNFGEVDPAPIPFAHAAADGPEQTSGHLDCPQAARAAVLDIALPAAISSSDSDSHVLESASVYTIALSATLPHTNMFYTALTLLLTILSPLMIRLTQITNPH